MDSIKTIAYIGAGEDTECFAHFPHSDFICVDSRPRNEYGKSYYDRGLYQANFKRTVEAKLAQCGFVKGEEKTFTDLYSEIHVPHLNSHRVIFRRHYGAQKPQTIRYYFSTGIPENLYHEGVRHEELFHDLSECEALFVSGYWPSKEIYEILPKPLDFIGSSTTWYPESLALNQAAADIGADPSEYIRSCSYLKPSGLVFTCSTYDEFYHRIQEEKEDEDAAVEPATTKEDDETEDDEEETLNPRSSLDLVALANSLV